MSKIQAPEPVAEVCSGHTMHWAGSGPIAPLCERTGTRIGSLLITTTQAEAYADARVREALEAALAEAKRVSDKYGYGYYGSEVDAVDEVGEAIRALFPPTE